VKQFPFVPCSAEGGARTRARARNRRTRSTSFVVLRHTRISSPFEPFSIPIDYEYEHRFTEHEHEAELS
jgi:hypothetical protein